jgi:hypothetical protein
MSIIAKNLASSPAEAATAAAPVNNGIIEDIDAVCVDVIDHGLVGTPWGRKSRITLIFEMIDELGNPRFLKRVFNYSTYSESALAKAIQQWLQIDISKEKFDIQELVGEPASLEVSESVSSSNCKYTKIESINPAGANLIQPSGEYRRKDGN